MFFAQNIQVSCFGAASHGQKNRGRTGIKSGYALSQWRQTASDGTALGGFDKLAKLPWPPAAAYSDAPDRIYIDARLGKAKNLSESGLEGFA